MIDLHMHTTYSDGTDTVRELLKKAEGIGLEIISITDHNTCKAYYEMEKFKVKEIYKGDIIVGCEFTTGYDNRLIEILGYGFDYKEVNKYLEEFYTIENVNNRIKNLYSELINRIEMLGLEHNIPKRTMPESNYYERSIYNELKKYPSNKEKIKEDVWDDFSDFLRKGINNKNSVLYIDKLKYYLNIKEIVNLIHKNGGVAFLAHPYQYKFTDTEEFLDKLYDNINLDGIECFYTTFSEEQTSYLVNFAKKRNLLISGGSDYHGTRKENYNLGIGRGNLKISKDVINNKILGKYYQ